MEFDFVGGEKEDFPDCEPCCLDEAGEPSGGYVVAVDSVGAGVGEVVLYASGSSARQTAVTKDKPCDAVIMAIVDQWDLDGETVYVK